MSHFIPGSRCRDLGPAALLVFLRHLLAFLFGKPVTFAEGLIFSPQSLVRTPACAICAPEAIEMFMLFLTEVSTLYPLSIDADKPYTAPGLFTTLQ